VRRHLLAAAVTAHLAAIALQAFPSPAGGVQRSAWADPTVQAEIRVWADRVGMSPRALEDRLFRFATAWSSARAAVLRPLIPYYRYAGTWQSWKMFVAPHVWPTRMQIEVRRGGEWQLVYRERSADAPWLAPTLSNDRFRATIFRMGWPQYGPLRRDFAAWVAESAAVDFPDATQVRVSFLKQRTRSAAEVRAGSAPEPERVMYATVAAVRR
jgi:hypothetical protein